MSAPSTNYLVLDPTTGEYNDLYQLFLRRGESDPSANLTGFKYYTANGEQDLNNLFLPLVTGQTPGRQKLPYNTNMYSKQPDGTELDLAAIFAARPNTNYLVLDPTTMTYNDLSTLFLPRTAKDPIAPETGFKYTTVDGEQDLNTLFYPWSSGLLQLPYNTNMLSVQASLDLSKVFVKQSTNANDYINVTGKYTYSYDTFNNYYTLVFADYSTDDPMNNPSTIGSGTVSATLTFKVPVNVQFTLVGGGGCGGIEYDGGNAGGGGGGGGGISSVPLTFVAGNTKCTLTVGGGSARASSQDGTASTVTIPSYNIDSSAPGGGWGANTKDSNYGGYGGSATSGGGAGGNGGNYCSNCEYPVNGSDGTLTNIYTNSQQYYFGGGGGGASAMGQGTNTSGGLGGGGGSGNGSNGNKTQDYNGPNFILYTRGSFPQDGWPGTGGGAGGAGPYGGGQGASGIVICCFQLA